MRHIPTTAARVEQLKKQAKRLKATKGGKHADLLNAVAKSAGYDHWHHVVLCNEHSERPASTRTLGKEIDRILKAESEGEALVIMTGPEITHEVPLIMFSTGVGDAWLVDPDDNTATCLMWQGVKRPEPFRDVNNMLEIAVDGELDLNGQFVNLNCPSISEIGMRAVGGYPVDLIRKMLLRAQSVERKMLDVIGQFDTIELTDEVISDLVRQGWDAADLARHRAEGAQYSPSRNTLLYPPMTDEDLEDEEPLSGF